MTIIKSKITPSLTCLKGRWRLVTGSFASEMAPWSSDMDPLGGSVATAVAELQVKTKPISYVIVSHKMKRDNWQFWNWKVAFIKWEKREKRAGRDLCKGVPSSNSSCLFVCDGAGLFMHGYLEEISCGCCEKSASVLKDGGLRHQQKRSPKRREY